MLYRNRKIHLLPTDGIAKLFIGSELFQLTGEACRPYCYDMQHLYITSDEKIQDGDAVYNSFNNRIYQLGSKDVGRSIIMEDIEAFPTQYSKVIATTDDTLRKNRCIPQPTQEFIDWYVLKYNAGKMLTDVSVKYDENVVYDTLITSRVSEWLWVNSTDNTIDIQILEKEIFTRAEVREAIKNFWFYWYNTKNGTNTMQALDDWMLKNL